MLAERAGRGRLQRPCCRRWKLRWPRLRIFFYFHDDEVSMKRMCGWWMTAVILGAALACLTGCKPSGGVKQAQAIGDETGAKPSSAPLDPATLGMVNGTVRFAGKAPQRVKIDMSQDPVCSMMGGDNFAEQYVVKDGKLANVYVYVKSGPAAAMSARTLTTAAVVLDQVGGKYSPHGVAVMRGGARWTFRRGRRARPW